MNRDIKFSIIMPFYNSEEYIERAILSVVNQTYDNWELIAVNDGSKDNSLKIINFYAKNDSRIRIVTKENGGYATAINFGLDNLSEDSDYFLLLGSDDEIAPSLFAEVLMKIKNKQLVDLIGFETTIVDEENCKKVDHDSKTDCDIFFSNGDIDDFYKNCKAPPLFLVRDTSRLFKTSLLGNLRYYGKYGLAADGIFSILFGLKCNSFAILAINGYIWHQRKESVSGKVVSLEKMKDVLSNWNSFFTLIVNNKLKLPLMSKQYILQFYHYYESMVLQCRSAYLENKADLKKYSKTIKRAARFFKIKFGVRKMLLLAFPTLLNKLFCIKHKSSNL